MKFRIVEYNEPLEKRKTFTVEVGQISWQKWFMYKIVWDFIKTDEGTAMLFDSFSNAIKHIEILKQQIPIYHNVK